MCFAPWVSLGTFSIEFLLAIWIIFLGPKKLLNRVGAAVLIFLGIYQFTEFMLCLSGNTLFWGKMSHLAYTFLPALGVHWAYALTKSKKKLIYLYLLPIIFSALVLATPNFVQTAGCDRYFISVILSWTSALWLWSYALYYGGFVVISAFIIIQAMVNENNRKQRKLYAWGLTGLLAFTVPTLLLILFFPMMNIMFPSILCEFALLFGIIVTYTVHLSKKRS